MIKLASLSLPGGNDPIDRRVARAYGSGYKRVRSGPPSNERARLNGQLNFISSEVHKGFGPLFRPALAPEAPEAREAAIANLGRRLDVVEQVLADGRPYLTGPEFSVADAYLFVVLSWAPRLGMNLARWPRLGEFSQRVLDRPAVQAAMEAEQLPRAA